MSEDVTRGLPADLVSVLRDQGVLIASDAYVFEMIAAWAIAPTPTASAEIAVPPHASVLDALYRQARLASSTTVTVP